MIGPGKYDYIATVAREAAGANGLFMIIIDGKRGNGFSVQCTLPILKDMPDILRQMADQIEADLKKGIV